VLAVLGRRAAIAAWSARHSWNPNSP